ncbi:recombinase family protein [Mycolicibacterium neoaurum]|uniref:recombinase family protein n=1 Tax=Mycolicibacterium neoaurum TaxID=1795 RepID=UPI0013150D6E|nr:recombinase family protein [Mycolicibacterium neoaurum]
MRYGSPQISAPCRVVRATDQPMTSEYAESAQLDGSQVYAKGSNRVHDLRAKMTAPGIRDGNRAVAYLRVSTDDQSTGIEAQRAAIDLIARSRGLVLVGEYLDENVSGTKDLSARPALSAAIAELDSNRADRLIVAKLDRLARDVVVAVQIDRAATRFGWSIVFGDLDIDTSTAAGKLQLSLFASVSQFERDRISERTREALAVKRAQGVKLGRPVQLPDAVLKRIRKERKAGRSLRAIATGLTADQVPTARGGLIWQVSTIQRVLKEGLA